MQSTPKQDKILRFGVIFMCVCLPDRRFTGGRAPPRAEAVVKLKNRTGVLQVVVKNRYSRRHVSQQSVYRST